MANWHEYIDTESDRWFDDYFDAKSIISSKNPQNEFLKQLEDMLTKDPRGINLGKTLLASKSARRYLYKLLAEKYSIKPKNLAWNKLKSKEQQARLKPKIAKIKLTKAQAKRMAKTREEQREMARDEIITEGKQLVQKLNSAEITELRKQLKQRELELKQQTKKQKQIEALDRKIAELQARRKALGS